MAQGVMVLDFFHVHIMMLVWLFYNIQIQVVWHCQFPSQCKILNGLCSFSVFLAVKLFQHLTENTCAGSISGWTSICTRTVENASQA